MDAVSAGETPPVVAITVGDPAGIGPEVVVKALADDGGLRSGICRPLIIGSSDVVDSATRQFANGLRLTSVGSREELDAYAWSAAEIPLWNVDVPGVQDVPFGLPTIAGGVVSITSIELAATLAIEGRIQAISTAPINKEAVHMAGYKDIGHQEVLARMTGVTEIATMLMAAACGPFTSQHTSRSEKPFPM